MTRREPTKSGILGLLAAAQGRSRDADLSDLVKLRFGVRIDQAGRLVRDFQTEIDWRTGKSKQLTYRHYLADAKFLAAVEGEREFLNILAENLRSPVFPLFLGRRSCPPTGKLVLGLKEESLDNVLDSHPWLASEWYRKQQPKNLQLAISRDCLPGELPDEMIRDIPVRFSYRERSHELRAVRHRFSPTIENENGRNTNEHDPFTLIGGA
ncbi:type I-E CRISPR-associated protein Cas5/CasD [Corynebacterium felinum]